MKYFLSIIPFILLTTVASAQMSDDEKAYVEANLLGIFYHELAHAVIHQKEVPIFGQEEDAADVFSVLMIDALYDEEAAQEIAYDAAFGYIDDPDGKTEVHYWDVHGPDEQRYYNHICVFVGANPEERDALAKDLGLPDERAEYCPDEFDQANESWGQILDEMEKDKGKGSFKLNFAADPKDEAAKLLGDLLQVELKQLNKDFGMPSKLPVNVQNCEEANAFYDPEIKSITMCVEFVDHLLDRMPL